MKQSVMTFKKMKAEKKKICMLTAYDYSTAKLVDEAGIHGILVGDSLGNVMLGYEDTIPVTMDDMIRYGSSVTRGAKNALVVIDMPFMSYQISVEQALENAGRLMKEGNADAIKLEGGAKVCPQIKALTEAGIPVMAHIGLTPQSVNVFGGFRVQGKSKDAAMELLEDAKKLEEAGAFAIVLEGIPSIVAEIITNNVSIPTIGIGAGPECDGQILINQDMFGMYSDFTPKFVKRYAEIGKEMKRAIADYMSEVESGVFPAIENQYTVPDEVVAEIKKEVQEK